jgi:hypothetical protein
MTESIFKRLRELVFQQLEPGVMPLAYRPDAVPIEPTEDGWICLLHDGQVAHIDHEGAKEELVGDRERATALIGNLALRFPIATWFLPRAGRASSCPTCGGTGTVPGIPANFRPSIVCRCGGLGWIAVDEG